MKKINFPINDENLKELKTGTPVKISGVIYTARDAAHRKLFELIKKRKKLPFNLKGNLIYYTGPSPAPPGKIIGSCGPTTSARMDVFTPYLYKMGLKATMGKGGRNKEVINACKKYKSIYLITFGGCGAYLAEFVKKVEVTAFEELGPEAIYRMEVKDFPAIVGIDIYGKYLYKSINKETG